MLKYYQLYDAPYGKSMEGLVIYAREKYPQLTFILNDSYKQDKYIPSKNTSDQKAIRIKAIKDNEVLEFNSLRKTSEYFNKCRSSILSRLDTCDDLDGWKLEQLLS